LQCTRVFVIIGQPSDRAVEREGELQMAQLTTQEFDTMIATLVEHNGFNRFYESLLKANALVSRKRPPNAQALATQLYQLSAGLRREHPARYAVEVLWQDMLSKSVDQEKTKDIENLIEQVNACLNERLEVLPEKTSDLVRALGTYHRGLASLTTDEVAYLEMLLRATTDVARFLRERKAEVIAAGAQASETQKTEEETRPAESGEQ
jgi:hypothetical protein